MNEAMLRHLVKLKKTQLKNKFKNFLYTREYLFRPVYKFKRPNRISPHKKHFYFGNDVLKLRIAKNNNYLFFLYFFFFLNFGIYLGRYIYDENYRYYLYVWYPDQMKEIDLFFKNFRKFKKDFDFPDKFSYDQSRLFLAKNINRLQNFIINFFLDSRNKEVIIDEQKEMDITIARVLDNFN